MRQPLRVDSYGRPLPALADVREASTWDTPTNQHQRQFLHSLVEEFCRAVCHRDWYGQAILTVSIQDGIVQRDMRVGLERVRRPPTTD